MINSRSPEVTFPVWKNWLSYIFPIRLEKRSSEQNSQLDLFLYKGEYLLSSENAIYSFGIHYANFAELFEKTSILGELKSNRVLILGLGMGSILKLLERYPPYNWDVMAVEFDEEIIDLASKYVLGSFKSSIEIIHADAKVFVELCQDDFDLICVDLYKDDKIPLEFMTKRFMTRINKLLRIEGKLIYNAPAYSIETIKSSQIFFDLVFSDQFNNPECVSCHKNFMLTGGSKKSFISS